MCMCVYSSSNSSSSSSSSSSSKLIYSQKSNLSTKLVGCDTYNIIVIDTSIN